MKVLLTGGTGFLGKHVLSLLTESSAIQEVIAVTRKKSTHPSSKVRVLQADLSSPAFVNELSSPVDAVIHLAGLYEFGSSFQKNYEANVLGSVHLLEALKKFEPTRILFSSTYAVGIGQPELPECRLENLPPREHPYAYTKALVERLLEDSPHSCDIFRLGVLIGNTSTGAIDRWDGPYSFYRFIKRLSRALSLMPSNLSVPLPVPADPRAALPLVPVDEAAKVLVQSLLQPATGDRTRYWGTYRDDSTTIEEWLNCCVQHVARDGIRFLPIYSRVPPNSALAALEKITGVAGENFQYAGWRPGLINRRFTENFGTQAISSWQELQESFFRGGDSA